jgi:hypothetical protein
MERPFFIMLYNQNGEGAQPMLDEDDEVAFFATREEALDAGSASKYAQAIGYEIFDMDNA